MDCRNINNNEQVINKIFNLYILDVKKYLLGGKYFDKKTNERKVNYTTIDLYREGLTESDVKKKQLKQWQFIKHLNGESIMGCFGGRYYSKFLCFDVDLGIDKENIELTKWIVYKITNELRNNGINNYYISFSGSKGYHIEIFFENLISNKLGTEFFNYILHEADLDYYKNEEKIELRGCTFEQGVKIPLGKHPKTDKYCGYCLEENSLKPMDKEQSEEYLLNINKIKHGQIEYVIDKYKDSIRNSKYIKPDKKNIIQGESMIGRHKNLPIYNPSEEDMENSALFYLENGLQEKGTRHNKTLLICRYFNYLGYSKDQMEKDIYEWLEKQEGKYTSSKDDAIGDTNEIIKYVIEKSYSLIPPAKDIEVKKNEFDAIITQCKKKNEKLLMYALLIHSKRFKTSKEEIFYMTYQQMVETTGLSERTVKTLVNKLIEQNVLIAVERNIFKEKTYLKAPNKYKVNLQIQEESFIQYENVIYLSNIERDKEYDFIQCINTMYNKEELKRMLTRREYEGLVG